MTTLRPRSLIARFALAVALGLAGCAEKAKSGGGRRSLGGTPPVLVSTVQRKVVPLVLDAVGAVEPIQTAAIRSQITGNAIKVHFREGQDVQEGDLLFDIDPRPFRNAVSSAEADVQKFRAQLENARLQVARYETLNQSAMVSKEQIHSLQTAERTLAAQLAASESALANGRLQLEYCSIRAPLSGRTGGLGAHAGDLVRAGDANVALVTINRLDPIYVTFGVPQQHLGRLARYRAAGAITVSATPTGAGESTEMGELTFLDNAVDPATGTVKLKATFPNPARRLWPGQFVTVRVTLDSPEALVVPAAALQNGQKGQHVFVVTEEKKAEQRPVSIERVSEGYAVIAKGLTEGETVVTDGQLRVVSGKAVEIKQPITAAATGDTGTKGKKKRRAE